MALVEYRPKGANRLMDSRHHRPGLAYVTPQYRALRHRGVAKSAVSERPPKVALIVGWDGACESIPKMPDRANVRVAVARSVDEASALLRVGLCPEVVLVPESLRRNLGQFGGGVAPARPFTRR